MKKIISVLMLCTLIFPNIVYAENEIYPADDVKIFVNEKELVSDVNPVIVNGRTLVPMRAIFEALGATVEWDGDLKQASGAKGGYSVTLTIDSDTAIINRSEEKIDAPAMLVSDRTMVPVRVVAAALNSDVQWEEATRTVTIKDKVREKKEKEYDDEETVIFFGDSITAGGGGYAQYIIHYLTTRYPTKKINYFNAGISGTTVPPASSGRLEYDVLADNPDRVFMLFGSNDLNSGPFWTSPGKINNETKNKIDTCIQRFTYCIETMQEKGIEVVLATPKMFDEALINGANVDPEHEGKNEVMRLLGEEIKKLAEKYNCKYADLWTIMKDVTDETRAKTASELVLLTADRTHPNDTGHLVMAYKYIKDLGYPELVAGVEVDVASKEITAENADTVLVSANTQRIEYTYYPKSLPFANCSTYKKSKEELYGIDIADINRELIKVTGLEEGEYKVYADDKVMLRATAQELAAGINIAECTSNPGQKKAMDSYRTLNTACQFVQSMRAIDRTEDGRSIKEYYKTDCENSYEKVLELKEKNPDNPDLKRAAKYGETEIEMARYMDDAQKVLVPEEYTVIIEKVQ